MFVVSSLPLAELQPMLEARFGTWAAPAVAKGVKAFPALPARPAKSRIVLIDRPGSPQSVIRAAQLTPIDPRSDIVTVASASDVLGGNFLSRMNMDLREDKGWSYGVNGNIGLTRAGRALHHQRPGPGRPHRRFDPRARAGRSKSFLSTKGVNDEELTRTVTRNISQLPGQFETSAAVLGAMQTNALYGRPDNYHETARRPLSRADPPAASTARCARRSSPEGFVWVVVGDAAKVRPQLAKLGLPIEVIQPR